MISVGRKSHPDTKVENRKLPLAAAHTSGNTFAKCGSYQSVHLATSTKCLSRKISFGLVRVPYISMCTSQYYRENLVLSSYWKCVWHRLRYREWRGGGAEVWVWDFKGKSVKIYWIQSHTGNELMGKQAKLAVSQHHRLSTWPWSNSEVILLTPHFLIQVNTAANRFQGFGSHLCP